MIDRMRELAGEIAKHDEAMPSSVEYDGKWAVMYDTADGGRSGFRVFPEFAAGIMFFNDRAPELAKLLTDAADRLERDAKVEEAARTCARLRDEWKKALEQHAASMTLATIDHEIEQALHELGHALRGWRA